MKRTGFSAGPSGRVAGFALAVIGSVAYGFNPFFCLPLYEAGYTPMQVVFHRYLIASALLACVMLFSRRSFAVPMKALAMTAAVGIMFAMSSVFLFVSFTYIDAGIASVILFVYPIFTALMSAFLFKERLSAVTVIAVAAAFAGICLLYRPGDGRSDIRGFVLAIMSGLAYAVYLIAVNRSKLRTLPVLTLTFYAILTGTVMVGIYLLLDGTMTPLEGLSSWMNAAGLAAFPTVLSVVLVTKAIHMIGSTPASITGALEPVTALCISILAFGGTVTPLNCLGIAIILSAVTAIVLERR